MNKCIEQILVILLLALTVLPVSSLLHNGVVTSRMYQSAQRYDLPNYAYPPFLYEVY